MTPQSDELVLDKKHNRSKTWKNTKNQENFVLNEENTYALLAYMEMNAAKITSHVKRRWKAREKWFFRRILWREPISNANVLKKKTT